jgi:hypothetical protein
MSSDGNVILRVKDLLFDAEDNPMVDAETGRQLRNNLAYHYGRKSFYPGETFSLPADVAADATRCYNPARPRIVEPLEEYEARQERMSKRAAVTRDRDRDAISREMNQLDQQATALSRMRQLAHERELTELGQRAPGAVTAHIMQLMDQRLADSARREATALGTAPPDLLSRLEVLEQQAKADRSAREAAEAKLAEMQARAEVATAPPSEPHRGGRGR